jgi:hypothetical protein
METNRTIAPDLPDRQKRLQKTPPFMACPQSDSALLPTGHERQSLIQIDACLTLIDAPQRMARIQNRRPHALELQVKRPQLTAYFGKKATFVSTANFGARGGQQRYWSSKKRLELPFLAHSQALANFRKTRCCWLPRVGWQDRPRTFPKSNAQCLSLRPSADRDRVAILKEATRFTGLQNDRFLAT